MTAVSTCEPDANAMYCTTHQTASGEWPCPFDVLPDLLEHVGNAIRYALQTRTFPPDPVTKIGGLGLTEFDIARTAIESMADFLGLTEERCCDATRRAREETGKYNVYTCDDSYMTCRTRLVGKWSQR